MEDIQPCSFERIHIFPVREQTQLMDFSAVLDPFRCADQVLEFQYGYPASLPAVAHADDLQAGFIDLEHKGTAGFPSPWAEPGLDQQDPARQQVSAHRPGCSLQTGFCSDISDRT